MHKIINNKDERMLCMRWKYEHFTVSYWLLKNIRVYPILIGVFSSLNLSTLLKQPKLEHSLILTAQLKQPDVKSCLILTTQLKQPEVDSCLILITQLKQPEVDSCLILTAQLKQPEVDACLIFKSWIFTFS